MHSGMWGGGSKGNSTAPHASTLVPHNLLKHLDRVILVGVDAQVAGDRQ